MLLSLCCSVVIILYCYCVALLLFVLSYVLIVCTVPLPPGVNPIAVDKYIRFEVISRGVKGSGTRYLSPPSGAKVSNEWICIVKLPSLNRSYWWTTVTFQILLMAHGLSGLGQQRLVCHPVLFCVWFVKKTQSKFSLNICYLPVFIFPYASVFVYHHGE